ncbi:ATP-binding protein [Pseudomonas fluorescens]|uniref:ATP-binding protein n=1 Tax=Pseudomonas fluorescens TaxID=294 RepID=UPI00398FAD93
MEDQGGGVTEADLQRIFDPIHPTRRLTTGDGGFGLGLSIARNAVQRQGVQLATHRSHPQSNRRARHKRACPRWRLHTPPTIARFPGHQPLWQLGRP